MASVAWVALEAGGNRVVVDLLELASSIYGGFVLTVVLLAWFYMGAVLTLLAAEVNVVSHDFRQGLSTAASPNSRSRPHRPWGHRRSGGRGAAVVTIVLQTPNPAPCARPRSNTRAAPSTGGERVVPTLQNAGRRGALQVSVAAHRSARTFPHHPPWRRRPPPTFRGRVGGRDHLSGRLWRRYVSCRIPAGPTAAARILRVCRANRCCAFLVRWLS